MARTIAEIQQEILEQKDKVAQLSALQVLTTNEKQTLNDTLTSTSKTSIWRLWVYIVAAAIWMHEKIVERNALLSRPHTLSWYREQALNYLFGIDLVWKEGFFVFDTEGLSNQEIENLKLIRYCSISERLFSDIDNSTGGTTQNVEQLIQEYYYNQVGIVTMKVAKEVNGLPQALSTNEKRIFQAYMNQIKDAGTQIRVVSTTGDKIRIELEAYVDPLVIYTEGENAGKLIKDLSRKPVEETVKHYIENLEFNGAFVPTFLLDRIQEQEGVNLPILRTILVARYSEPIEYGSDVFNDADTQRDAAFFVPTSGYFNTDFETEDATGIVVKYFPYNLQTDPSFNL